MDGNPKKLFSTVNTHQLFSSLFKSGSYNDTQLVCSDKIIFANRLLLSLTFPSMGEVMVSVGEWVDHIIMMPDYTSLDLLKDMESFLSKLDNNEEIRLPNNHDEAIDTSHIMDKNEIEAMANIEEVYVIKEEMKVEVVEESCVDDKGQVMCESVLAETEPMAKSNILDVRDMQRLTCEFEECGLTLKNMKSLKEHIKNYHTDGSNVRIYPCYFCTGTFKGRRAHFLHKEKCIGVPQNYKCPQEECTFTCLDYRGMLSHFKKHEKQTKNDFSCEICGQQYTTTQGKIRHMMAYPGPHVKPSAPKKKMAENHPCPICAKVFKKKFSLNVHINAAHDEEGKTRYKCDQCNKGFASKDRLKAHFVSHTDEKRFPCTTCAKKFKTKRDLLNHDKIHSGVKPFKCSFCGKAFINSFQLRRHDLIHTGVMDYSCASCGKAFNQKVNLAVHERKCIGVTESQPPKSKSTEDPHETATEIFPPSKL